MTDFDNNKEKHTVCTGEIRRFVSGLEWDSWGQHPHVRELPVSGMLQQRAVKKLASECCPKTFAPDTSVPGLGIGFLPALLRERSELRSGSCSSGWRSCSLECRSCCSGWMCPQTVLHTQLQGFLWAVVICSKPKVNSLEGFVCLETFFSC